MAQIDCRGLACPEPVLRAKAALEEGAGSFEILVDNEASRDNVLRFGHSRNCRVELTTLKDGSFLLKFLVEKKEGGESSVPFDQDDYSCAIPGGVSTGCNLVYVIASDSMGRGSDELGWALLQTYIATIKEISPQPSRILFYNGGVKLVATAGKALEALQALEKKGVKILSCGTCLEFFKLETKLQVGTITNMYEILDSMASADKVVSPF
ncbi:MAG: sulfurtransferase-like selenium metabolism protein YedF [Proteobacteria bacterium]|nr:sulfurtransferase-like selenium metabolism protein YedF [Pseudomonadota bacterium]MBU1648503.1 sulfurtransferase-like selenium metabolism protein YedF [Pseudomonadota bacterium]MBU1986154.1 sulfurtransferase-like selenium metabolism protein YedF [Pseudomonadota bacterium]